MRFFRRLANESPQLHGISALQVPMTRVHGRRESQLDYERQCPGVVVGSEAVGSEQQPKFILPVRMGGYGNRVAFSLDSQHLATGGEDETVKIWSAQTGQEEHTLRAHTGDVFAVAFSPNGRWLASAGEDTTVRIWDADSWKLLHTLRGHTSWINSLTFSRDGLVLASGSRDHTVKIWDRAKWANP